MHMKWVMQSYCCHHQYHDLQFCILQSKNNLVLTSLPSVDIMSFGAKISRRRKWICSSEQSLKREISLRGMLPKIRIERVGLTGVLLLSLRTKDLS